MAVIHSLIEDIGGFFYVYITYNHSLDLKLIHHDDLLTRTCGLRKLYS